MQLIQKNILKLMIFCIGLFHIQAHANERHAGNWLIKKVDTNACVAQYPGAHGALLEPKKLTIAVKEMGNIEVYQVSLNDKVVLPANKPNLVDTSCNCVRLRNMEALQSEVANIRIDAKTSKNNDITIKLQLKDISLAMAELTSEYCHKPQKNLNSLSVRQ